MASLDELSRDRLEGMAEAGADILECYRLLGKTNANIVGELLKGEGDFYEWDHYPKGDVYDSETHSQYYYHAHPAELRSREHGHFHTFLRPKGMPHGIEPADVPDLALPSNEDDALSHLVGISMDRYGHPIRLFTTNRWVTGEVWYRCDDVIRMLDNFHMDLAYPSLPVNIWISAMLRLYRPQIEQLLIERDRVIAAWQRRKHNADVFEDREIEVTAHLDINVEDQVRAVDAALNGA